MCPRKGITPLPWRTDKCYCGYIWSGDKMFADFPMDEDEGTYLARMRGVGRGATQQEQQANAAFIVHACNRYDEAVSHLRWLFEDPPPTMTVGEREDRKAAIRGFLNDEGKVTP